MKKCYSGVMSIKKSSFITANIGSNAKNTTPAVDKVAFSCPHCNAHTHQFWFKLRAQELEKDKLPFFYENTHLTLYANDSNIPYNIRQEVRQKIEKAILGKVFFEESSDEGMPLGVGNLYLSKCYTCNDISVWSHKRLLYPAKLNGDMPNQDLPESIKETYKEAQSILNFSPRGACALLRLCIQSLCIHLGEKGKNINDDIGSLVEKGLDKRVQQALDVVRVNGNNAVHPGEIDLTDDIETAQHIFKLINLIAEKMISEPKHVQEMFDALPLSAREGIKARDGHNK